ncbi:MAG: septum formation initiator family protein [Ruminococcus sp.]|nr:septum formation initiator family protein [Ruminococcus sp.]
MGQKKMRSARGRRKQASIFRQHKRSVVTVFVVLGMLAAVLYVNAMNLYARNEVYKQQEAELQGQIKEQKQRSEEVKKYEEYVKTDDYIKDVAEEKLGLVDPNEILFQPEE